MHTFEHGIPDDDLRPIEDDLHVVAEDLSEGWVEEWADRGLEGIEGYLAKHAAFLRYLDTRGRD